MVCRHHQRPTPADLISGLRSGFYACGTHRRGAGLSRRNSVGSTLGWGRQPGSGGFNALANALARRARCGAAWRTTGGIRAIANQLSVVRQILRGLAGRCHLLLFEEQGAVHDDDVRHWRVLLRKPILPALGTAQCAGSPTSPPAYMTASPSRVRPAPGGPRFLESSKPSPRPTSPDRRGTGSRSRTRTALQ
jgi:hypothetical protein